LRTSEALKRKKHQSLQQDWFSNPFCCISSYVTFLYYYLTVEVMQGKMKNAINRIIIKKGHRILIHWKCDICGRVFGAFKQLKVHKIEIHTY